MSARDESVYVRHMLDAIQRIERHIHEVEKGRFRVSWADVVMIAVAHPMYEASSS